MSPLPKIFSLLKRKKVVLLTYNLLIHLEIGYFSRLKRTAGVLLVVKTSPERSSGMTGSEVGA